MQLLSKSQQDFFADIDKLILKFIRKTNELEQLKQFGKRKNKFGAITLPYFKNYCKTTVIKRAWHFQRNRHRSVEQNKEPRNTPT